MMIFLVAAAVASAAAPDWRARVEADARGFHAEQAANHPGPYNRLDPGFAQRLDAALAQALRRAAGVTTPGGYMFAIREMVAGFDDGHVYASFSDKLEVPGQWPGFVATWRDGAFRVVHVAAGVATPAVGDRIVDCDGRDGTKLLAELVAPWRGSWQLVAQQERNGWRAFHDQGNPWVKRPAVCRVATAGGMPVAMTLDWRPQPADFADIARRATAAQRAPIELRGFPAGRWISAGSFSANEGTPAATALPALMTAARADAAALRGAPVVVLDLRGNSGGSSDWGVQLARSVWGDGAVDAERQRIDKSYVEWRATPANLAAISAFCTPQMAGGPADFVAWCTTAMAGVKAAIARGEALWREPDVPVKPVVATAPLRTRPTFLLVDSACGSACLDTVDLWTAMGAVVVGRTTSADTDYMEVRDAPLPSGLGTFSVPIKVYRGRARGSGVPVEPAHVFAGEMADTAALEAWVAGLAK